MEIIYSRGDWLVLPKIKQAIKHNKGQKVMGVVILDG